MPEQIKIKIDGMSCQHCKMSVDRALSQIDGITTYRVDLEKGEAEIVGNFEIKKAIDAINRLGYRASLIQ